MRFYLWYVCGFERSPLDPTTLKTWFFYKLYTIHIHTIFIYLLKYITANILQHILSNFYQNKVFTLKVADKCREIKLIQLYLIKLLLFWVMAEVLFYDFFANYRLHDKNLWKIWKNILSMAKISKYLILSYEIVTFCKVFSNIFLCPIWVDFHKVS